MKANFEALECSLRWKAQRVVYFHSWWMTWENADPLGAGYAGSSYRSSATSGTVKDPGSTNANVTTINTMDGHQGSLVTNST